MAANEPRSTASSGVKPGEGSKVYESQRAVDEYLDFHFGAKDTFMPYSCGPMQDLEFPRRCAELLAEYGGDKALDIGCAVGGTAFHMTKYYNEVIGIDFSHAFVNACNEMKEQGRKEYQLRLEADIMTTATAVVAEDIDRSKATFEQGDACNLREDLPSFDAVLGANLVCRLPEPRAFLNRLPSIVNDGGVVVLITPFSWLPEYTPKDKWLGGYVDANGCPVNSFDTLESIMVENNFELQTRGDIPFMIREHARKYQWGISDFHIWRKLDQPKKKRKLN